MATIFIPDKSGFRELAEESDFSEIAEEIAAEAKAIAPVGDPNSDPHAGAYRDSIEADGNYVIARAFYAWILEYGTVDTPTFATLRTAARNRGHTVIESGSDPLD